MKSLLACLAACCLLAVAPLALAAEFTADMTQTQENGPSMTGKVAVKDAKMRMEAAVEGQPHVSIMNPETKTVIMLMPAMKSYMEVRFDVTKAGPGAVLLSKPDPAVGQWKVVGTETVDGWECEKRVMDFADKSKGELTAWFAVKLDAPVKFVQSGPGGTFTVTYKNIKAGPVDEALFAVPPGYQQMQMPAMPKGGMGQ